jgi:hypothetical protein
MFISLLLPPLAPFLILYREEESSKHEYSIKEILNDEKLTKSSEDKKNK